MQSTDATTGMRLASNGRFDDALPYLERAHRTAPTDLPTLHAIASVLQTVGRGVEAVVLYRESAARLQDNVEILAGWARASRLIGDREQAVALLDRAIGLDPAFADEGSFLDMLLSEIQDADEVRDLLDPLVARHADNVGLLLHHAKALVTAECMQHARDAYERYRALRPLDPVPLVELARLAINRGDPIEAGEYIRSALAIAPDYGPALWEKSQIDGGRLDASALAHVQKLEDSETDPWRLAPLLDVLAIHHDRVGDYALAAGCTTRANALQAALVPPRDHYVPELRERETDVTIANLTRAVFDSLRGAGDPDRRPVFVIGMPRSGTTLLQQMLVSHPSIVSVGEQQFASESFRRALIKAGNVMLEAISPAVIGEAARWHLQRLQDRLMRLSLRDDAERIIDKLPDNYMFAGWLAIAFPNTTIVHCLRDPRDVALSCWRTQFSRIVWGFDLAHVSHRIEQHRRLMRHWRSTIGGRLTEIRYERLVADPETELRRVLAALGLDWHPDVLAFAQRKGFVRSASQHQVREPLHARGIGHWRNYEAALRPVMSRLEAIVAQDAREATPDTAWPAP